MKIVTVVGARPQFVKASAVSRAIQSFNKSSDSSIEEILLHTGQHYDSNMSQVFFSELDICVPKYNLGIFQCSHGEMTGKMLIGIEGILQTEQPDLVLVYGDTNSTLAGALAAVKLHIPVVHVEAGLRSFNNKMPEETNRIVTDRIATMLFCPTSTAVVNLNNEGIENNVYNVGDVMYDVTLHYLGYAKKVVDLSRWSVEEGNYSLCTLHRAENTDTPENLTGVVAALQEISLVAPVVFPVHPRTKKCLEKAGLLSSLKGVNICEPVSYFEMLRLESSARVILTDSGGVQKEAFFNKVPCITLRNETEWVETVTSGANTLCGTDAHSIVEAWNNPEDFQFGESPYGDGYASQKIVEKIFESIA